MIDNSVLKITSRELIAITRLRASAHDGRSHIEAWLECWSERERSFCFGSGESADFFDYVLDAGFSVSKSPQTHRINHAIYPTQTSDSDMRTLGADFRAAIASQLDCEANVARVVASVEARVEMALGGIPSMDSDSWKQIAWPELDAILASSRGIDFAPSGGGILVTGASLRAHLDDVLFVDVTEPSASDTAFQLHDESQEFELGWFGALQGEELRDYLNVAGETCRYRPMWRATSLASLEAW